MEWSLVHVEQTLWCVTQPMGLPVYDFNFERFFHCRHPQVFDAPITAVARLGASEDYAGLYDELRGHGIRLIHTPGEYELSTKLPNWYPILKDLTPRSRWYDAPPALGDVEGAFSWPIFMKGERQTSRHQGELAIIRDAEQFRRVMDTWATDPILGWQRVVCREYVPLRAVGEPQKGIPTSYEFRTFCWHGQCVGIGRYWYNERYHASDAELAAIRRLSEEAAQRLGLPFLVVDIAQTSTGEWIVIECNDGQESGYAGVSPISLWQNIVDALRSNG